MHLFVVLQNMIETDIVKDVIVFLSFQHQITKKVPHITVIELDAFKISDSILYSLHMPVEGFYLTALSRLLAMSQHRMQKVILPILPKLQ